eukprot:6886266-Prymnesium_polylepis.3
MIVMIVSRLRVSRQHQYSRHRLTVCATVRASAPATDRGERRGAGCPRTARSCARCVLRVCPRHTPLRTRHTHAEAAASGGATCQLSHVTRPQSLPDAIAHTPPSRLGTAISVHGR